MYLVVIGILALVLAFVHPPYQWVTEPGLVVSLVAAATLLPAGFALLVARLALRLWEHHPDQPSRGQYAYGRGTMITQTIIAGCHATVLLVTDWLVLCGNTPLVGGWVVVPGLLAITPFLLSIVLVWIAVYPAERAVRQLALEAHLLRGRPVRPVWSLGQFLVFNARHQVLFILAPMVLILAARDVIQLFREPLERLSPDKVLPDLLLGAAAAAVAIIAPGILRRVWVTRRLPDGPLRDRLHLLCRTLRLRCREILVWQSGGMIVNAAVMGVIAPLRYVMITDGMLEQMQDIKIEAVFGHEVGHVKRHHILFFLLFAFISGCLITILSIRTRGLERITYQIVTAVAAAVLVFKWGLLFGWISRRFERQADVFAVRTLAQGGLPCSTPCALHEPPEQNPGLSQAGDPLCSTAAHLFGNTLHEVAALNGIPPAARSWRHSSIASRSRFVQKLAQDPLATLHFERALRHIKLDIALGALLGGLWAAWELRIWTLLGWGTSG